MQSHIATDTKKDAKTPGKVNLIAVGYHLFKIRKELASVGGASAEQLKYITAQWTSVVKTLEGLLTSISTEIALAEDKSEPDHKDSKSVATSWREFNTILQKFIVNSNALSRAFTDARPNEEHIAHQINILVQDIYPLLASFAGLNLNSKFKEILPDSLQDVKNYIATFLDAHIKNILPANFENQIAIYFKKSEPFTAEDFSKLSSVQQDLLLIFAQQLNHVFRDVFLSLDRLGIQLSITEGYLTERKLEFLGNKSLRTFCETLCNNYKVFMNKAGYRIDDELFPYSQSIYKQRQSMLEKVDVDYAATEKKQYDLDLIDARKRCIHLIEEQAGKTSTKKKLLLTVLKSKLQDPKVHIVDALKKMETEKLNVSELRSGKTAETIKLIQDIYNQVEKSRQQRLATRDTDKARILKRLKNHPNNISDEKYAPVALPKTTIADVVTYVSEQTLPELKQAITLLTTLITGPKPAPVALNNISGNPVLELKIAEPLPKKSDMHAIQKTISTIASKLMGIFDEEAFKQSFITINNINLDQKANAWIQEMGSSFHNIQSIAASLSDAITKRAINPGLNLIHTAQTLEHISQKVRTITESIQQMQNNAFIQQFTSLTGIKSFLTSTFATIKDHQLPENPIAPAHHQASGIESIILRINSTYSTLAEKITHNKKLDDSVSTTTNSLIKLLNDAKDLYTDPLSSPGTFALIKYTYNHLNLLMQLFNHVSRSINVLQAISKDFYLSIAQNINLLIKDLFLIIDKLELTFYLKEGFLLNQKLLGHYSLRDLSRQFNDSIESQGYEFPQTERFPYTESIQAQRNTLASSATLLFEKEFIQRRIQITKKQLLFGEGIKNINKNTALHYQKINIKNHITHLLTQRMKELTAEIATSLVTSPTKLAKKELLSQLHACYNSKDHLNHDLNKTGDEYIDDMINHPGVLTHIHHLFEGRTGKLIKELQNCKTTRHDILIKIDSEIESLKQQRDETYYYSAASRKTLIEDKIFALEQFRLSMEKAGYTFDDALNELKINNLTSHDILFNQTNELLHDLRQMDQRITPLSRGKKAIGMTHTTNYRSAPLSTTNPSLQSSTATSPNIVQVTQDYKHLPKLSLKINNTPSQSICITQEIVTTPTSVIPPANPILNTTVPAPDQFSIDLINHRIADLKNALITTTIKQIKIDLLTHLTNNLATMPLTQAIQEVRNQSKFKMNFYLLFEGRTGEMMKTIQHRKLSKDDITQRIHLAIIRLKSLRTQNLYFFAQSRKQKQETCIKALYAYKEAILNNKTSTYSLTLISAEYQDILKDNERNLLVDIHHWEKIQNQSISKPAR